MVSRFPDSLKCKSKTLPVIGGFCEHGAEVHRLLERAVVAKVRRADTERGEDPRGYGARVREKWAAQPEPQGSSRWMVGSG